MRLHWLFVCMLEMYYAFVYSCSCESMPFCFYLPSLLMFALTYSYALKLLTHMYVYVCNKKAYIHACMEWSGVEGRGGEGSGVERQGAKGSGE